MTQRPTACLWSMLSTLSPAQLADQGQRRDYPKWNTLCLIRSAGLPTLDAVLVPPGASWEDVLDATETAADAFATERVLVRSDGGAERGAYYTGGMSIETSGLLAELEPLFNARRAIILMEPTDRLANHLAVNVRVDRDGVQVPGRMVLEALGPGFDNADLNRGGILPGLSVAWPGVDFRRFEEPEWLDLEIDRADGEAQQEERLARRLEKIGRQILPRMTLVDSELDAGSTADWLKTHGYDHLWRVPDWTLVARHGLRWLAETWRLAAMHPNRTWTCLSVSVSDLGDGRLVYWDVVDATTKFALDPSRSEANS